MSFRDFMDGLRFRLLYLKELFKDIAGQCSPLTLVSGALFVLVVVVILVEAFHHCC